MTIHRTIKWLSTQWLTLKWLTLGLVCSALCGCFGGTIAQQIARSVFMQGADKATAAAVDAHDLKVELAAQKLPLKDTPHDPYRDAFLYSSFKEITPQVEPLPATTFEDEKPIQMMRETKLVQVEVWNLLVGDEKQHILEKARKQGATDIPPQNEWQQWQIAIGGAKNTQSNRGKKQQSITFLIPPEIGKMHSGAKALVELSGTGELNIARYALN